MRRTGVKGRFQRQAMPGSYRTVARDCHVTSLQIAFAKQISHR